MTRWGRQAEVTAPTSPSAAMLGHASVATMLRLSAPVTQVGAGALVDANRRETEPAHPRHRRILEGTEPGEPLPHKGFLVPRKGIKLPQSEAG